MNDTLHRASEGHGLRCPKCDEPMTTYERSGIMIDRCQGCRGLFLDRGELERLVDAESAAGASDWRGGGDWDDDDDDDDDRRYGRRDDPGMRRPTRSARQPRRRSFLNDLLEGFGE